MYYERLYKDGVQKIGGKVPGKTPQTISQPTVDAMYQPSIAPAGAEVAPAPGSAGKGQMGGPKDAETSGHTTPGDKVTAKMAGGMAGKADGENMNPMNTNY